MKKEIQILRKILREATIRVNTGRTCSATILFHEHGDAESFCEIISKLVFGKEKSK